MDEALLAENAALKAQVAHMQSRINMYMNTMQVQQQEINMLEKAAASKELVRSEVQAQWNEVKAQISREVQQQEINMLEKVAASKELVRSEVQAQWNEAKAQIFRDIQAQISQGMIHMTSELMSQMQTIVQANKE